MFFWIELALVLKDVGLLVLKVFFHWKSIWILIFKQKYIVTLMLRCVPYHNMLSKMFIFMCKRWWWMIAGGPNPGYIIYIHWLKQQEKLWSHLNKYMVSDDFMRGKINHMIKLFRCWWIHFFVRTWKNNFNKLYNCNLFILVC